MHRCLRHGLVAAVLMVGATAQTDVVVPPGYEQTDAGTLTEVAGFNQRFRQQIVIRAAVLGLLSGRSITDLAFRRDGQHLGALGGGSADLVVVMSERSSDPSFVSPSFAANHGSNSVQVLAGRVAVPASPALSHRNGASWTSPHAVTIPLATPWLYGGRHLCIELVGAPVAGAASRFWPVDAALHLSDAQVTPVGAACDSRLRLAASRSTLVPGGTVRFVSAAPAGSSGAVMLGMPPALPGIDLGFLNAPGCRLFVMPAVSVGVTHTRPVRGTYGDSAMRVTLPAASTLLGGAIGAQLFNFGNQVTPSGIATSHALELRLASVGPPYDVVQVRTGPLGLGVSRDEGEVVATTVPVLRLSAQ